MSELTCITHERRNCRACRREHLRQKLMLMPPWRRGGGSSYASCRFCHRGLGQLTGLWKYSIRHYICDDCKVAIETGAK